MSEQSTQQRRTALEHLAEARAALAKHPPDSQEYMYLLGRIETLEEIVGPVEEPRSE